MKEVLLVGKGDMIVTNIERGCVCVCWCVCVCVCVGVLCVCLCVCVCVLIKEIHVALLYTLIEKRV